LIASEDAEVARLLDDVVIVMDPVMNPDGRERFLAMVEQSAGYVTNLDYASMHRGRWPQGRGNHYLFDMNRDWMTGVMPETRGRWQVALAYHPQLFVDAHEMDAFDTFLFYRSAIRTCRACPRSSEIGRSASRTTRPACSIAWAGRITRANGPTPGRRSIPMRGAR
jgi:hypothetical protein